MSTLLHEKVLFNRSIFSFNDELLPQLPSLAPAELLPFHGHYTYTENVIKKLDEFCDSIVSDTVILSSSTIYSLFTVKKLLERGKRVVFGGNITLYLNSKSIRDGLRSMGAVNLDNLVVVTGYVDEGTNIEDIIHDWVDCVLPRVDLDYAIRAEHDYTKSYRPPGMTPFLCYILNNHCTNNCAFCSRKHTNGLCVRDHLEVKSKILRDIEEYSVNKIWFKDSSFIFNGHNKFVIHSLPVDEVWCYVKIADLLNKEYIDNLNTHMTTIVVGLDSTDDFALQSMGKNYSYDMIEKALANINKYMKKSMIVRFNFILDLPYRNKTDVYNNYHRLGELRSKLPGVRVQLIPFPLYLLEPAPIDGLVYNEECICGEQFYLKMLGFHTLPTEISTLFSRKSETGSYIESDYLLLGKEKLSRIMGGA